MGVFAAPGRVKLIVAAAGLGALLLWLAGAAVQSAAREIGSLGLAERLAKLDIPLEDVYRASAREHYEIFTALRRQVPRDVHLVIYTHVTDAEREDPEESRRIKERVTLLMHKLRSLLFPALVTFVGVDVPNVEAYLARVDPSFYVVNITPDFDFPGQAYFDLVERGETFSLYRFRGPPRKP